MARAPPQPCRGRQHGARPGRRLPAGAGFPGGRRHHLFLAGRRARLCAANRHCGAGDMLRPRHAIAAEDASVLHGRDAVRARRRRRQSRDLARRNADARLRDSDTADRPRRQSRTDGKRPHQADARCGFDRLPRAALRPGAGQALGADRSRRYDRRLPDHRLCQAVAADRSGAAGELRFLLRQLFHRYRRQRLLSRQSENHCYAGTAAADRAALLGNRERARKHCRPYQGQNRRRRRRDCRGVDCRGARRHPGRGQRSDAAHRHLPHHLHLRPAHGAGCRHHHGVAAWRLCAVSRFLFAPPSQEICSSGSTRLHRRLSRHFRRRGCRRAQLHHAGGHACRRAV